MLRCIYATALSSFAGPKCVVSCNIHITLSIRVNIFGISFDMCILLEYVIVNVILGCILNNLIRLIKG